MWPLTDPTNNTTITQGIDTFCDDTTLLDANTVATQQKTSELVQTMQTNLTLWNGLLEASGRVLNPTKCACTHFKWHTKSNILQLQPHFALAPTHVLQISQLRSNPSMLIQLQPHTPYQYLGIHLTMNRDWNKELQILHYKEPEISASTHQMLPNLQRSPHHLLPVLSPSGDVPTACGCHTYRKTSQNPTWHHHCIPHQDGIPTYFSTHSCICSESGRRCGIYYTSAWNKAPRKYYKFSSTCMQKPPQAQYIAS